MRLPDALRQQYQVGGDFEPFLLSPHGVAARDDVGNATAIRLCKHCISSLRNNKLPQEASVNGLASCTSVPDALADLTEAEQRFLSLNQPGAKMVCIVANSGRRTLLGHSFTVVSDLQQAVDTVLPRTTQQVNDSLFVAYAGPTDGPEKIATLKKYRVRRSAIRRALLWLIAHYPLY